MTVIHRNWLTLGLLGITLALGLVVGCGDKPAPNPTVAKTDEKEKGKKEPDPPVDPLLAQVRKGGSHWSSLAALDLGEEIGTPKPHQWELGTEIWLLPEEDRIYVFKKGPKDKGVGGDIRCKWRIQGDRPLTKELSKPEVRCAFQAPENMWYSRKEKEGFAMTKVTMELPAEMKEGLVEVPLYFSAKPLSEDVFVQIVVGEKGMSNILRLKVKVEE